MRWLRGFLESPDPAVRVAAGLSEPEAGMWQELLENNGIPAFLKNMNFLSVTHQFGSMPGDYDLFVQRSDLGRARELLEPLLRPGELVEDGG
jgi:hypothetical protein